MKPNKIFDGMTFVHSFEQIKKRTEELNSLFLKTQTGEYEPTSEEFWDLQIKVAELKDKFVYVYSGVDNNMYLCYNDKDENGDYVWTIDYDGPYVFYYKDKDNNDTLYNKVIECLRELNAPEEFIEKFNHVYIELEERNTELAF